MTKPDDADRAKHAKEELDQAIRELETLDPAGQARVLELLPLDKPSLELLLELLEKLKDGRIEPDEYRKMVASLQVQSLSENKACVGRGEGGIAAMPMELGRARQGIAAPNRPARLPLSSFY